MAAPNGLFLGHMLTAMDRIVELVGRTEPEAFDGDWILQDGVMRELEVLGEAAGRVSPDFVRAHPEIPWQEITGLRHKIVWRTATVNVPEVLPLIRAAAKGVVG